MSVNPVRMILFLAIVFLIVAGIVWLQVFSSKKESKWPGLIMPLICLLISLLAVFGLVSFAPLDPTEGARSVIFSALYIFVLYNIPTAVLLAIYAGFRNRRKKNLELEKMKIKDLN